MTRNIKSTISTYYIQKKKSLDKLISIYWYPPPEILETKHPDKEVNRMTKNTRFSPEVRQRAVRMVL
ncbi:hypothetical protein EPT01_25260, partial [Escherichia coli]